MTVTVRERDDGLVEIDDVVAMAETEKALLVVVGDEELWVPHSQIHDDSEVYRKGDEGTLVISRWVAEKRGLL